MSISEIVVLREITAWDGNTPNHTYHIAKKSGKLIAYENVRTGEFIRLKKSLSFSRTRRKFKQIRTYQLDR